MDWLYYGIFFNQNTKEFLIGIANEFISVPNNWKLYGDHMTIVFNDGSDEKNDFANSIHEFVGQKQSLEVESIGVSDKAIAFGVSGFPSKNRQPHITIAVSPESKPVISNEIKEWKSIKYPFNVTGIVKKVCKK